MKKYTKRKPAAELPPTIIISKSEAGAVLETRTPHELQEFIERMRREQGTTVFLTTHDMDEADRLCDRIAIINGGKIVALDTPRGLKQLVGARNGSNGHTTMEDVFLTLTGRSLDDDFEEEEA